MDFKTKFYEDSANFVPRSLVRQRTREFRIVEKHQFAWLFMYFLTFELAKEGKKIKARIGVRKKNKNIIRAPCEDRTHDLQISTMDYETDALPTALTRPG